MQFNSQSTSSKTPQILTPPRPGAKTFHKFNELPPEIRILIWKHAQPETRILYLGPNGGASDSFKSIPAAPHPVTLFVNTESREETKKTYKASATTMPSGKERYVFYNIDKDVLIEPNINSGNTEDPPNFKKDNAVLLKFLQAGRVICHAGLATHLAIYLTSKFKRLAWPGDKKFVLSLLPAPFASAASYDKRKQYRFDTNIPPKEDLNGLTVEMVQEMWERVAGVLSGDGYPDPTFNFRDVELHLLN